MKKKQIKKKVVSHLSDKEMGDSELFNELVKRGLQNFEGRNLMIRYLELSNLTESVLSFIDEHKDED